MKFSISASVGRNPRLEDTGAALAALAPDVPQPGPDRHKHGKKSMSGMRRPTDGAAKPLLDAEELYPVVGTTRADEPNPKASPELTKSNVIEMTFMFFGNYKEPFWNTWRVVYWEIRRTEELREEKQLHNYLLEFYSTRTFPLCLTFIGDGVSR